MLGVLALLQNYKPIFWGCAVIKLSPLYYPPSRGFTPLYKCVSWVYMCVFAQPCDLGMTFTLGIISTMRPVDWQLLIALWFEKKKLYACALLTHLSPHLKRHRCTNATSTTHIHTPHFYHFTPETRSLSGEAPGLTPFFSLDTGADEYQ